MEKSRAERILEVGHTFEHKVEKLQATHEKVVKSLLIQRDKEIKQITSRYNERISDRKEQTATELKRFMSIREVDEDDILRGSKLLHDLPPLEVESPSKNIKQCVGCLDDQANQFAHMDPGGCMFEDSSPTSNVNIRHLDSPILPWITKRRRKTLAESHLRNGNTEHFNNVLESLHI